MSNLYIKDYIDTLEEAEACEHKTPSEEDFVYDVRERFKKYGNGAFISEKQLAWLENIAAKSENSVTLIRR